MVSSDSGHGSTDPERSNSDVAEGISQTTDDASEAAAADVSAEPASVAAAAGLVSVAKTPKNEAKKRVPREVVEPVPEEERWLPPRAPRAKSRWVAREQRLTVQILSALVAVGFATWASGKWFYNEHPPEGDRYKPADLSVLANRPKNAAMEFHHSLCVLDFERATELAFPSALPLIEARRSACDAACLASRDKRVASALTRATLIEAKGRDATADAECHFAGAVDKVKYRVRLEGAFWRVVDVVP